MTQEEVINVLVQQEDFSSIDNRFGIVDHNSIKEKHEEKNKENDIGIIAFLAHDDSGTHDASVDLVWTIDTELICV